MSRRSFEQRLAALEEQMANIKVQQNAGSEKKDWRRTVGKFPGLQEVFAEAMKLRQTDRKKAHARPCK